MTTLEQKLNAILLPNDLAREQQERDIKIFNEWLLQKREELKKHKLNDDDLSLINSYIKNELLEELEQ